MRTELAADTFDSCQRYGLRPKSTVKLSRTLERWMQLRSSYRNEATQEANGGRVTELRAETDPAAPCIRLRPATSRADAISEVDGFLSTVTSAGTRTGRIIKPEVPTKAFVIFLAALGFVQVAVAQTADDYRGGWRTDKGEAHTYEFSIRGDKVRGIYCTYCADAITLAFVDGSLGADGITFVVTHVKRTAAPLIRQGDGQVRSRQSDRDRQQRCAGRGQVRAHAH
jgi:hypothetical protein